MIYETKSPLSSNTSVVELYPFSPESGALASWHQVSIDSAAVAGQWNVEFMYVGSSAYVAASPISAIMASGADAYKPIVLEKAMVKRIRITPSGVTAGATYTATAAGGD